MEFNKFQTPIDDLIYNRVVEDKVVSVKFKDAPKEVQEDFYEYLSTVPLIQWLVSPERPYIQDLPRDKDGKAIWDIERPPIIEDTDYFRPTALHFQQTGRITDLRPNGNPNSEYKKWVDEEVRRIREGYLRESDGAYISGWMYWYLNYNPIILTVRDKNNANIGYRTTGFPEFWEGIWWRYTGWDKARSLGQHFAEISKRGSSKSYTLASALNRIFVIGEKQPETQNFLEKTNARAVIMAYQKEFLIKDGTLNKFEDMFAFTAQNTQFPRKTIKSSLNDMDWVMGYLDLNTGTKRGTGNEVIGVAVKDDPGKGRGKRAQLIGLEEFGKFPNVAEVIKIAEPSVREGDLTFGVMVAIGCVCAGTKVYTKEGIEVNIEDLRQEDGILGFDLAGHKTSIEDITYIQEPAYKECVKITAAGGISIECSYDHPILTRITHTPRAVSYKEGEKRNSIYEYKFVKAGDLRPANRQAIVLGRGAIGTFGTYEIEDPYLIGLLIGDGSYGHNKTPRLSNCDSNVLNYVKKKYVTTVEASHITKDGKIYEELRIKGICHILRNEGIYGQVKASKRLPCRYKELTEHSASLLLAGLFDTDGHISKRGNITLCSSSESMLNQVKELLLKFAIYSTITRTRVHIREGRKDRNDWFTLRIAGSSSVRRFKDNIPIIIEYKKAALEKASLKAPRSMLENMDIALIKSVEHIGIQRIYNLTANNTHTYLANGIITHNTGGEEGNDFSGALDLIYHPSGSHFVSFENVWDKSTQTRGTSIFCFPAYINRKGCYNKDGISDVTKALYALCFEYYIAKYENPDPMQATRTRAENPVTLQDAIMRRDGTRFPVNQINERIQEIDFNPNFFDNIATGDLVLEASGKVKYVPTSATPIHKFPTKDNKVEGAIEFYRMPEYNSDGKVFSNRYIAGIDPVQNDGAKTTMSLISIFVLDLWTDMIVCEWTGRLAFADDGYERARLICIFYNATLLFENNKMGVYAHFKTMQSLYLLAKTPEHLKAIDKVKVSGTYGNSSYGVSASNPVNEYARDLLVEYMLKPVVVNNEEGETTVSNVMTWWNRAALEEARQWNPNGNFDRISALGILMIYRQERIVVTYGNVKEEHKADSKANDPFFTKNYKRKSQ